MVVRKQSVKRVPCRLGWGLRKMLRKQVQSTAHVVVVVWVNLGGGFQE